MKKSLLIIISLFISGMVFAGPVSVKDAGIAARNYYSLMTKQSGHRIPEMHNNRPAH
jgi:uncharacterized protein YxeA